MTARLGPSVRLWSPHPAAPEGHDLAADHPERRALPVHLHPAAAALFDRLPDRLPDDTAHAAMAALERGRADLGPGTDGAPLTVDAYRVRLAASCPASAAGGDQEFSWTPATAARHLGLRALALHLCGLAAMPVEVAAATVVDELSRRGGDRTPGPWLATLDPAGRAVAQAEAQRWAEQAVAWLPLRLVGRHALRFLDDDWWPAGARRRPSLLLHGRRDVTIQVAARRVAVTVAGGMADGPGAVEADAFGALAGTLCDPSGRLVRVVRIHPATGEVVATDVTAEVLERGVAAVLATAGALLPTGAGVAARPGSACTWCARRQGCAAGTAWVSRPNRHPMGLPLPAPPPAGPGGPPIGEHRPLS